MLLLTDLNLHSTTEIYFEEEGNLISVKDLTEYLKNLKGVYGYFLQEPQLLEQFKITNEKDQENKLVQLENSIFNIVSHSDLTNGIITKNYKKNLGEKDLFIKSIIKQSPMEIIFLGTSIALTASIILSGGKLEMSFLGSSFKFKLNALGDGIKKIQKIIQQAKENRIYEIHELPTTKYYEKIESPSLFKLENEISTLESALLVPEINNITVEAIQIEIEKKKTQLKKLLK